MSLFYEHMQHAAAADHAVIDFLLLYLHTHWHTNSLIWEIPRTLFYYEKKMRKISQYLDYPIVQKSYPFYQAAKTFG